MNDYYADLGVARGASAEEIKRAYRKAARRLHPDVNPGPEAEEQFKKVSQAYDVLGDADKKRSYDMGADPYAAGRRQLRAGLLLQRHHGRLLRCRCRAPQRATAPARAARGGRTPSSDSTSTSATRSSAARRS